MARNLTNVFARSFTKLAPLVPSIRSRAPMHHIILSASTRHFSDSPKPADEPQLRSEKDMLFDMAKIFEDPMLKALRKRAMRAYALFFVAGGALCIALKKLFNDKFAEDEATEQQALKQQQEQQHQLQPRLVGYSLGNEQSSTPLGRDGSDLEREYREFQEFKRFQEQKRLREQQRAEGVSSSKAP